MRKYFAFLLLFAVLPSCKKETLGKGNSICIEEKIESFKHEPDAKAVQRMLIKEEYHYWFNTDARFVDGPEYILNSKCDTVCSYGRLYPANTCIEEYNNGTWEIVWKK